MIPKQPIAWAVAALLGLTATAANAAEESCMTSTQLGDLVLVATPNILAAVRDKCGPALASDSVLRDPGSRWATQYQAAAKEAWPRAKEALIDMRGADMTAAEKKKFNEMLSPALIDAILTPLIAKAVTPQACPTIDHVVTLLAPLPPANLGQLVSFIADVGTKNRQGKAPAGLRICQH